MSKLSWYSSWLYLHCFGSALVGFNQVDKNNKEWKELVCDFQRQGRGKLSQCREREVLNLPGKIPGSCKCWTSQTDRVCKNFPRKRNLKKWYQIVTHQKIGINISTNKSSKLGEQTLSSAKLPTIKTGQGFWQCWPDDYCMSGWSSRVSF